MAASAWLVPRLGADEAGNQNMVGTGSKHTKGLFSAAEDWEWQASKTENL